MSFLFVFGLLRFVPNREQYGHVSDENYKGRDYYTPCAENIGFEIMQTGIRTDRHQHESYYHDNQPGRYEIQVTLGKPERCIILFFFNCFFIHLNQI